MCKVSGGVSERWMMAHGTLRGLNETLWGSSRCGGVVRHGFALSEGDVSFCQSQSQSEEEGQRRRGDQE